MLSSSIIYKYNSKHKQVSRLCSQETKEWLKTVDKENAILLDS